MRLNLQTKLLASVILLVVVVLVVLIYYTITQQREVFQSSFKSKGIILAQTLEASIGSREELQDLEKLQSSIYKLMWLNPEIVQIDISVSTPEGMQIAASNNTGLVGTSADLENEASFNQGEIKTRTLHRADTFPILSVITPIHVGGQRAGTYDIRLSLTAEVAAIGRYQKQLTLCLVAAILFITISLSLFLRRMVITPVVEIRKGLEKVKAGNLDWRITPKSKDELGDLARGFNETTEKLKESHLALGEKVMERTKELEKAKREIEGAKGILEVKVKARTKELEGLTGSLEEQVKARTEELKKRISELERFHRATVGRETKMIELKKEVKRLKEQLGEKEK